MPESRCVIWETAVVSIATSASSSPSSSSFVFVGFLFSHTFLSTPSILPSSERERGVFLLSLQILVYKTKSSCIVVAFHVGLVLFLLVLLM